MILIHQMSSREKAQESQSPYQAVSTSQQTLQKKFHISHHHKLIIMKFHMVIE
jgi:hypothetical protein